MLFGVESVYMNDLNACCVIILRYNVNILITATISNFAPPPLEKKTNTCKHCQFMYVIAGTRLTVI